MLDLSVLFCLFCSFWFGCPVKLKCCRIVALGSSYLLAWIFLDKLGFWLFSFFDFHQSIWLKIRQVQCKILRIFLLYLESPVHICGAWYFNVGGVKFLKPMMLLMTVMLDDKHDTFDNLWICEFANQRVGVLDTIWSHQAVRECCQGAI